MTREEAIKYLISTREYYRALEKLAETKDEAKFGKALDMAIEALHREEAEEKGYCHRIKPKEYLSADAVPTVIRSKTLMPTKDFKVWAKRIREENPNAVIIPCDAEVVSADSVVRCKDCKQRRVEGDCTHYYCCDFLGSLCGDNEYCSFGERREP